MISKEHERVSDRLLILFCVLKETDYENEGKIETVYIGDNSKVIEIVNQLTYPNGISYSKIAIQSKKEQYELKIFLDHIPESPEISERNYHIN